VMDSTGRTMKENTLPAWQKQLRYNALPTLLAAENKAISYFARRELLGEKTALVQTIWELPQPQKILKKQLPDGRWEKAGRNKDIYPANHYALVETFKNLRTLVEQYGFTKDHPAILKAADYLFTFQTKEGDVRGFIGNQYAPYYTGYVLSLLIMAGYKDDPRIEKGLNWLLSIRQADGGWTIPMLTHKLDKATQNKITGEFAEALQPDRTQPFSHNWTDMALRALAVHPVYRKLQGAVAAGRLLKSSFFLPDNYGSYHDPAYWTRFVVWWPNLLTALEILQPLGFPATDPDIKKALDWFTGNQQPDGLWRIEQDKAVKDNHKEEQLWLSLRICRMLKMYFS
jgi:hypothetical protein